MGWLGALAAVLAAGCQNDPTYEAAPTAPPGARALPNAAGQKRMMGPAPAPGKAGPAARPRTLIP